jgi:hypothetical protein
MRFLIQSIPDDKILKKVVTAIMIVIGSTISGFSFIRISKTQKKIEKKKRFYLLTIDDIELNILIIWRLYESNERQSSK